MIRHSVVLRGALIVALALVSGLGRAETPCEPGRGPSVRAEELREMILGGSPVSVPAGAAIVGAIDRSVICPGVPDDAVPCIVPAPLKLACVQITAPLALRNVVVDGELDLSGSELTSGLSLENSEILGDLVLSGARVGADLVLDRVLVGGMTQLERATIDGRLLATGLRSLGSLSLEQARAGRGAELRGAAVGGDLALGLAGGPSLTFSRAVAMGAASLRGLKLSGALVLEDLTLAGALEGTGLEVGGDARATRVAVPDGVMLGGVFRRDLTFDTLTTDGELTLTESTVDGNLVVLRGKLGSDVAITGVQVGKSLRIEGSDVAQGVDLAGTTVGGELVLISSRFGALVDIGDARLTARPRVVACTPANPLGEDEPGEPQPIDEAAEPEN
ncbi:MAG: hypothetical protein MUE47_02855 [Acidobacteria bacterium]|nr:hypothetical protein [Acidobacteriota bacterium]